MGKTVASVKTTLFRGCFIAFPAAHGLVAAFFRLFLCPDIQNTGGMPGRAL